MKRIHSAADEVTKYESHAFSWVWTIGNIDGQEESDYFFKNARRLADLHGVQPHELALSRSTI